MILPRSLAVEIVDAVRGHTMESAICPKEHESMYDYIEHVLHRAMLDSGGD